MAVDSRLDCSDTYVETERFLSFVLKSYTILYVIGVLYLIYSHQKNQNDFLLLEKSVCLLVVLFVFILFSVNRIRPITGIVANLVILSLSLYISIVYEGFHPGDKYDEAIMVNMLICFIPCTLGLLVTHSYTPFIVSAGALLSYAIAAFQLADAAMYRYIPLLVVILFGVSFFVWCCHKEWRSKARVARLLEEQQCMLRFFQLEQDEWHRIKDNNLSVEETKTLLLDVGKRILDRVVNHVQDVVLDDEMIMKWLKSENTNLTTSELEICCHIVHGRTITEICEIRHVNPSTVTSIRSHIRTKLKLRKEDNLQYYLCELVCRRLNGG